MISFSKNIIAGEIVQNEIICPGQYSKGWNQVHWATVWASEVLVAVQLFCLRYDEWAKKHGPGSGPGMLTGMLAEAHAEQWVWLCMIDKQSWKIRAYKWAENLDKTLVIWRKWGRLKHWMVCNEQSNSSFQLEKRG